MTENLAQNPALPLIRVLRGIDTADWDLVRGQMTPQIETDYRSLFGAPAATSDASALVAQWRSMLMPLDGTQHLLGAPDVEVDGDTAVVRASVRGDHWAHGIDDGETWTVVGQYEARVLRTDGGWRMRSLRLDTHQQSGNRRLVAQAGERAQPLPRVEGVHVERVRFTSMGEVVTGHLFLPQDVSAPVPGVVVLGSWTTVKEQMAGLYAAKLAQRGFATLAFDPRGYGESAGEVRCLESAALKMDDVRAALAFMRRHPRVKDTSVGAMGICAGAGYVAGAVADDPSVGAVALVAPWLHDAAMVEAIYGGAEGVAARHERAAEARARFETTGEVVSVPAVSAEDEDAAMFGPFDYYLDPKRGAVDAWPNRFATMGWTEWLDFDPHPFAARVKSPLLLVHGEEAALPEGAHRFFGAVESPKHERWMDGTQFHFYDDDATVTAAVDAVAEHMRAHL